MGPGAAAGIIFLPADNQNMLYSARRLEYLYNSYEKLPNFFRPACDFLKSFFTGQ